MDRVPSPLLIAAPLQGDERGGNPSLSRLTPLRGPAIPRLASGDELQGAAADCNSAGETHAWFDSRVAHHPPSWMVIEDARPSGLPQ